MFKLRRPPVAKRTPPSSGRHPPLSPPFLNHLASGTIFALTIFSSTVYFLLRHWKKDLPDSLPRRLVSLSELVALFSTLVSLIHLGIDLFHLHSLASSSQSRSRSPLCAITDCDDDLIQSVVVGSTSSCSLESRLGGDYKRAVTVRRKAIEKLTGKSLSDLPVNGFDYKVIYGQCCELPVGYVQLPVGVAGPLLLDGKEYFIPMATTEGCLVASTNRGCKAITLSGGATSVVVKDGMTRAPVVRLGSVKRASEVKLFVEDPLNLKAMADVFNGRSKNGRLRSVKCGIAGRNLYIRFECTTGDAMGINIVSKGVQHLLEYLHLKFPDMETIGISGNYCSDKKATAVNWIEGRGKWVVCEATIKGQVVNQVLKTSVEALVELNNLKNLTGSALAGSIGGFNAHASNIVTAVYLATGQDPAQNVESSNCMTLMEPVNVNHGHCLDLHISVTMPSIEVGTVGGGTELASQAACLNLLGVKGPSKDKPGSNSRFLAKIIAGSVLAGELSLMSALAAGQLVKSHLKYNRSNKNVNNNIQQL